MTMQRYERCKILGKGAYGRAVLCKDRRDGRMVVIKEVSMRSMPPAERTQAKQEAELLLSLKHPNIVACYESFIEGTTLCIVMALCSGGDLGVVLQRQKGSLPEETILDWFVQICLAIKHVHDHKILHRDVKPQNVFLAADGLLKLGDFGVSKVLDSTTALAATGIGTPYYLSPEICHGQKYSFKSDIWSAGCILYEMTCGKRPFDGGDMGALMGQIKQGRFRPVPPRYSQELRSLIGSILQPEQSRRPTMEKVLSSPFLRSRIEKYSRSQDGQQLISPPGRDSRDQPATPSVPPQQPPDRQVPPAVPVLNINQVGVAGPERRRSRAEPPLPARRPSEIADEYRQQLKQAHAAQQAYAAEARKAAREDFASRQRQAMRNKAAAEGQLGIGAAYMSPSPPPQHAPDAELARRRAYAARVPPHEVYVPRRPPPAEHEARRPSRDRYAPEGMHRSPEYPPYRRPSDPGARGDVGGAHHRNRGSDSNPGELSPEERRRVFEENKAAAARNRRALMNAPDAMFIEVSAEPHACSPQQDDNTIRWQPGSSYGGPSEGPTLKPRLDDFKEDSLQRPIWPGTDLSPQLPPPLPTPAINEPDSVIPGGACPREVREPSFSGQDQRSQHGHNEHIPTDGPFDGQQGRDVCNTPPQAPEKSREHAGVPGSQGIVCSNAHGAHLSPGTAARGHMHCQQVAGHQNEPHVHAAVEHGPEAPDTPEQHAGGGSPVIEGPQRHESAQRESGPGVAALEHQLADVRISHQRESADGGERKHRLWEGDDDWDIHRNAAVDEDATAASAPLLGAQDGSPGGSSNTGIQQPHAVAWEWKDDGPDVPAIGNPKRWEDAEELVHSDFSAIPAGTGALMHQCTQPVSPSGCSNLPTDGTAEIPTSVELQTLELQQMASLTVSPRKRPLEQCPSSAQGKEESSEAPASPEDMPLQSFSSLTIAPRNCSVEQVPPSTVVQCMNPVFEGPSTNMGHVSGVPNCIEAFDRCSQHLESLTVGPARPSLGQDRPMSPGRYEDAESVTSFGATWVDADHCAEVDAGDPSLAAAMATTNDNLEQVPDIEDPLAGTNRNTSAAPVCCGEGGQGEGGDTAPATGLDGSVVQHAEMMRGYLEGVLGPEKFLKVYERMHQMYRDESYDAQELSGIVQKDKLYCLQMVQQLVIFENNMQAGVIGASV